MIHLALWIVSALFLLWFFAVCGTLLLAFVVSTWRWLLGAALLLGVVIYANIHMPSKEDYERGQSAIVPPSAQVTPPRQHVEPDLQPLVDSVRSAISQSLANSAPPIPEFTDSESRGAYLRWLGAMSDRLKDKKPQWLVRKEFLQTVWYESRRAGLDTALVLGLAESVSGFHAFFIDINGARGYLAVSPDWSAKIGDGDAKKLFHMQTNLRFGCVILRHYIDRHAGDLNLGLGDYFASNLAGTKHVQAASDFPKLVLANARHWEFAQ
jgi:hypothetical protein